MQVDVCVGVCVCVGMLESSPMRFLSLSLSLLPPIAVLDETTAYVTS